MAVRCVAYQKARDALTKNFNFVDSTRAACCSDASTTGQGCTGKDGYGSRKIHVYLYLVPLAMRTSAVGVVISLLNG